MTIKWTSNTSLPAGKKQQRLLLDWSQFLSDFCRGISKGRTFLRDGHEICRVYCVFSSGTRYTLAASRGIRITIDGRTLLCLYRQLQPPIELLCLGRETETRLFSYSGRSNGNEKKKKIKITLFQQ